MATDRIPETPPEVPPPPQIPPPQAPSPPQYYPPYQHRAPDNSLGRSSLVLGITGTVLDLISLIVLWPLCILALLIGGAGLSQGMANRARISKGSATNQTGTTAGIVFSALAIGLSVIFIVLIVIAHITA